MPEGLRDCMRVYVRLYVCAGVSECVRVHVCVCVCVRARAHVYVRVCCAREVLQC
jgi:hypothetical protein